MINGQVILRTGRRIPSVRPLAGVYAPISVVRMAVEDAYGAKEWREGSGLDEVAYSTRKLTRRTCRSVAEFTFRYARRNGAKLPTTAVIDQFYGDVQDMGGNRWDTSSLLARLERK